MAPILGNGNPFNTPALQGQCTFYAAERYHQMTGKWVSWGGNAYQWAAQAQMMGWSVSGTPPSIPSIICLQPGIQLADPIDGHVGVVESVAGNTVNTSNLNWGVTPQQRAQVSQVQHTTGIGVSFIWAGGGSLSGLTTTLSSNSDPNSNCITIPTPLGDQKICMPDFSWLTKWLGGFGTTISWLQNPMRIAKMLVGITLIGLSLALLVLPEAEKVGVVAAKVAAVVPK